MNENEVQVFMNEVFGEIRILEQNDGKVLFCGKDVANSLNYASTANAIAAHCKGVTEIMTPTNGGTQAMKFITEGDLYRLITHSRRPDAEKFERWVFASIHPQARQLFRAVAVCRSIPTVASSDSDGNPSETDRSPSGRAGNRTCRAGTEVAEHLRGHRSGQDRMEKRQRTPD